MMEKYTHTPRGNVYYWLSDPVSPDRETILFLHGLTADHRLFARNIPFFEGRYNVIVWDAPAHGKSRPYEAFSYPDAVAALKQIMDENGVRSAIFVGQSMGGFMTQSFLKRFPEMVSAFVAVDSCPYGEDYYSKSDQWWLRRIEPLAKLYPEKPLKKAIAKQCTRTPYAYENMLTILEQYSRDELCHLMGIGYAEFLEENCDLNIPCPVLILCGDHDITGKVKSYCKAWAAKTGYPLQVIPNAAHNANADNPEAVNRAILAFVQSVL